MRTRLLSKNPQDVAWLGWAKGQAQVHFGQNNQLGSRTVFPDPAVRVKYGRDGGGLFVEVWRTDVPYYPVLTHGVGPNTNFQKTHFYIDGFHNGTNVDNFYYRGDAAQRIGRILIASNSGSVTYNGTSVVWVNWPLTGDQNNYNSLLSFPPGTDGSQWDPWDVFNGYVSGITVPATTSNPSGFAWSYFVGTRTPGVAGKYSDALAWEKTNNGKGELFAAGILPEDWNALLMARHPSSADPNEISPVEGEKARITLFGPDGKTSLDDWVPGVDTKIRVFGTVTCTYSAAVSAYVFKTWKASTSSDILRFGSSVYDVGTNPSILKIVYESGAPLKIVTASGTAINPIYSDGSPVKILTNAGVFVTVITSNAPNTFVGSNGSTKFNSLSPLWLTADKDGNVLWFANYPAYNSLIEYGNMKYTSLVTQMNSINNALSGKVPTLSQDQQLIRQVRSLLNA